MHIVKEVKRIRGKACFSGSGFILFWGKGCIRAFKALLRNYMKYWLFIFLWNGRNIGPIG